MVRHQGQMRYAWFAYLIAHVSVFVHLRNLGDLGFRDVYLYYFWQRVSPTPVFQMDWVYPLGAAVPMSLIRFVSDQNDYLLAWLAMVALVNAVLVYFVGTRLRNGVVAVVWWMAFIALIGPTAFARLDAFSSALAIAAVVLLGKQTAVSSGLLASAGWVKVAHFFWLPILFVTSKKPWREVFVPFAIVTAIVGAVAWLGGAGARLFGFITNQNVRGLQAESSLGVWFHAARMRGDEYWLEYNDKIYTVEFVGDLPNLIARYSDYVMFAAVGLVTLLTWRAMRRRRSEQMRWIMWGLLGVTVSLLLFNKVGSPQLMVWLAAPMILLISQSGKSVSKRTTAILAFLALLAGGASQIIFPLFYQEFFDLEPWVMAAYFARSLILIILFLTSVTALARRVR